MFLGILSCTGVNKSVSAVEHSSHNLFVSGNFGEVHIGQLKDEWNESESTLVAIKTIRGVYISLSYTHYWSEHSSAEVQGAAVTYYIPTGRRHDDGDTLLCSKVRLQIITGRNHCNYLVLFFSCSRN